MPISWESNVWHLIAFTYSSSNSSLYLDGVWATNGPGVSYRPGPSVLTNGFFIGSDSNGLAQAHGQFDDLYTYNYELAQDDLASVYILNGIFYGKAIMGFGSSAPSNPSTNSTGNGFYAVTGPGWLQYVNHASSCASNANLYITNVSCSLGTNGLVTTTFEIQGGSNNVPYDVFGTTALTGNNITNAQWAWLGQGTNCTIYRLPNQPGIGAFYVLGTPKDSDSDGLTDAYEALVSKSDIHKATTGEDGMLDGWAVIFGLDPRANNSTQPSLRSNFAFDPSPQLKQVRGIRQETFGFDGEGNVKLDQ
jgi:hypothetical protein